MKELDVFSTALLGDLITLYDKITKEGKTVDDVRAYLEEIRVNGRPKVVKIEPVKLATEEEKQIVEEIKRMEETIPLCPKCESKLRMSQIGCSQAQRSTNDKYKTRWLCSTGWEIEDPKWWCGYEFLDKRSIKEIQILLRKGTKVELI